MKCKTLFIISFVISIHYCFSQRAFTNDQLIKEFPKKEVKYKLSKRANALSDSSVVSANAVYVLESEEVEHKNDEIVRKLKSYTWMRFFNDGRVFISFA